MRFRGMLHFDNCQQHNALVLSQYHCDTRSYMQIETKAMPRSPTNTIQFFQFHAICCCHKCDTWIFNVMMMQKWSIESCAVKEKKMKRFQMKHPLNEVICLFWVHLSWHTQFHFSHCTRLCSCSIAAVAHRPSVVSIALPSAGHNKTPSGSISLSSSISCSNQP